LRKILPLAILLVIVVAFVIKLWPDPVIEYEAGVLCPDEPVQTSPSRSSPWLHKDFMFTALADYEIRARVLSRRNYGSGTESDISPVDFALGWGRMSDQFVLDRLKITQGQRWYRWKVRDIMPIPQKEIERSSANVHIIPGDKQVEKAIDKVYVGSVVHMKGYLVKVTQDGGWRWVSSMSRDDTGDGACEVLWVESMTVQN
jgi:hypothetical protein